MTELHVETLGAVTRAWEYGAAIGAPLILVHGFRGDHHGLEAIAQTLVQRYPHLRVIVPDLPGFGKSEPVPGRTHDLQFFGDWLRAFSTAVAGGQEYVLLGHSFGSLVVSQAVATGATPNRVILINPISAPALEGPQAILTKLAVLYYRAADVLPETAARGLLGNPVIVRVMSAVMAKTRDPQLRSWIHAQHDAHFSTFSDTHSLLEAFEASISHTVVEFASSYNMPVLIIVGERDDIAPLPAQLRLHRRIRDSRLTVLPGIGHLVHYEGVDDATAEIAQFLADSVPKQ